MLTSFKIGSFTVNKKKNQVDRKYALQTLHGAIRAETGVNATDDFGTDRVTSEETGELVLGAKDDTLNFFWMARLQSVRKNVVKSMFLVGKSPAEPGDDRRSSTDI